MAKKKQTKAKRGGKIPSVSERAQAMGALATLLTAARQWVSAGDLCASRDSYSASVSLSMRDLRRAARAYGRLAGFPSSVDRAIDAGERSEASGIRLMSDILDRAERDARNADLNPTEPQHD